jgi:hypothetical protein
MTTSAKVQLPTVDLQRLAKALYCQGGSNPAGLAIATTTTKIKTTNTWYGKVDGVPITKAGTDNLTLSSAGAPFKVIPASKKCLFLVVVDASLNVKEVQSEIVPATAADPDLPEVPHGYSVLGQFKVQQSAAGGFTPGTTGLDDASTTDTYGDLIWPTTGADGIDYLGILSD